jgi:sialate O-acetylesterase
MHLAAVVLLSSPATGEVKIPAVFSDHMVLQRGMEAPVWGWADAGEKVTVTFGEQSVSATADQDGKWRVKLGPLTASDRPAELVIGGKTISDVLVGEVWVCSGQSNMAFRVAAAKDSAKEIADAKNYPSIRLCGVPTTTSPEGPMTDNDRIQWCGSDSVGSFTAVGYFFGRSLHKHLEVPVGLISSSVGGTPAEAWTSRDTLETLDFLQPRLTAADRALKLYDPAKAREKLKADLAQWAQRKKQAEAEGKAFRQRKPRLWDPHKSGHHPATLYNGMIAPFVGYGIRGAVWYQGEANASRAKEYRTLFPAMITDWRKQWGQGDFPFYFVQLANFLAVQSAPVDPEGATWPYLREAQTMTLALPNTGMACAIDLADADNPYDIHPKNKQDVGDRLALWARARTYGEKDLVYSGPLYKAMKIDGGKIVLAFDHVGGGLEPRGGGALKGFAIAGEDKQWVWADAAIEGETVVVSSPQAPQPTAVRYDWANNPIGNLHNAEGLPACPFRTDVD